MKKIIAILGFLCLTNVSSGMEIAGFDGYGCPITNYTVCGKDGKTYLNSCLAKKQFNQDVAYDGQCLSDLEQTKITNTLKRILQYIDSKKSYDTTKKIIILNEAIKISDNKLQKIKSNFKTIGKINYFKKLLNENKQILVDEYIKNNLTAIIGNGKIIKINWVEKDDAQIKFERNGETQEIGIYFYINKGKLYFQKY